MNNFFFQNTSATNSFPSTGHHTPGSPKKEYPKGPPHIASPTLERKLMGGKRDFYAQQQALSPTRRIRKTLPESPTKNIDPKFGPPRKTAGVRNLPKIDKKERPSVNGNRTGRGKKDKKGVNIKDKGDKSSVSSEDKSQSEDSSEVKADLKKSDPLAPISAKKNSTEELEAVEEALNEE